MGVKMIDTEVVALFNEAALGKTDTAKEEATNQLKSRNPAVADLADVFHEARRNERDHLSSRQAILDKYDPLFQLASDWSAKATQAATARDKELAINSMLNGGSKADIEQALSGVTNTRNTLTLAVGDAFNKHQDQAKYEESLAKLAKMDPDLAGRLQGAIREVDQTNKMDPLTDVISDIHRGAYDKYGLSKAAYDFNELARMDPKTPEFKTAFDQASQENKIIGPYLMEMKKIEMRFLKDGELSDGDEKALGMLQKGFAASIKEGKELPAAAVNRYEVDHAPQP